MWEKHLELFSGKELVSSIERTLKFKMRKNPSEVQEKVCTGCLVHKICRQHTHTKLPGHHHTASNFENRLECSYKGRQDLPMWSHLVSSTGQTEGAHHGGRKLLGLQGSHGRSLECSSGVIVSSNCQHDTTENHLGKVSVGEPVLWRGVSFADEQKEQWNPIMCWFSKT